MCAHTIACTEKNQNSSSAYSRQPKNTRESQGRLVGRPAGRWEHACMIGQPLWSWRRVRGERYAVLLLVTPSRLSRNGGTFQRQKCFMRSWCHRSPCHIWKTLAPRPGPLHLSLSLQCSPASPSVSTLAWNSCRSSGLPVFVFAQKERPPPLTRTKIEEKYIWLFSRLADRFLHLSPHDRKPEEAYDFDDNVSKQSCVCSCSDLRG